MVLPNQLSIISPFSLKLKTAENVNFSSFGLKEHILFESFSGSIGITLSTKYIEVAL